MLSDALATHSRFRAPAAARGYSLACTVGKRRFAWPPGCSLVADIRRQLNRDTEPLPGGDYMG